MSLRIFVLLLLFFIPGRLVPEAHGLELITTRYTTIIYEGKRQLQEYNEKVVFNKPSAFPGKPGMVTAADEAGDMTDAVLEQVEMILDMFPTRIKITIMLLPSRADVQKMYQTLYQKQVDFIAFYAPKEKTMFLSVPDTTIRVLAHEMAHAIIDHYFKVSPPEKIHEVLSQYAESHITD